MAYYGNFLPHRTVNHIVLYLSSKQATPGVPFELQGAISPDVWAARLPAIVRLAERYSKPLFERLWVAIGIIATVIVPVLVYNTLLSALHFQNNADVFDFDNLVILQKARAISGGISLALILLFTLPYAIWKFIGRRKMQRLLQRWAASDNALVGNRVPIPVWSVRTPGLFNSNTVLTITIPHTAQPSAFHPNAYLPSYINPPADVGDTYFYPYRSDQPGLPRMSVVGKVPLSVDEKQGFEDVKV